MKSTRLYLDIDETIIAEFFPGSGYDLRPGMITQIAFLAKLFEVFWVTHHDEEDVESLFKPLYAKKSILKNTSLLDWRKVDKKNKAPAIVEEGGLFYWLEDPLSTGDMKQLRDAGYTDRYIPVAPRGPWGFVEAVAVLFQKAEIGDKELEKVGAKIGWFRKPLANVRKANELEAGTLRTGFVSNGKQHCGDCIHRSPISGISYCIHSEVVRDPELISRVVIIGKEAMVPISDDNDCCGYMRKK